MKLNIPNTAEIAAMSEVSIPREVVQALLDSLRSLREAGVFVWPNHPMNPELHLQRAMKNKPYPYESVPLPQGVKHIGEARLNEILSGYEEFPAPDLFEIRSRG
jgi:hypothetical protein